MATPCLIISLNPQSLVEVNFNLSQSLDSRWKVIGPPTARKEQEATELEMSYRCRTSLNNNVMSFGILMSFGIPTLNFELLADLFRRVLPLLSSNVCRLLVPGAE
jgi:hypothetical protein